MSFYRKIVKTLDELKKAHPKCTLGKHISTAIDSTDMNDLWSISDKELHKSLINYQAGLDMDISHDDDDIEQIIEGGKNLWADQY
jgi:hypothetical protein